MLEPALEAGPYLLGDVFTAADILAAHTLHWGRTWQILPESRHLADYLARTWSRPALQRALQREGDALLAR